MKMALFKSAALNGTACYHQDSIKILVLLCSLLKGPMLYRPVLVVCNKALVNVFPLKAERSCAIETGQYLLDTNGARPISSSPCLH